MGNCTGFCMTSAADEHQKKVTADKVKSALYEKEEMYKEINHFEDYN